MARAPWLLDGPFKRHAYPPNNTKPVLKTSNPSAVTGSSENITWQTNTLQCNFKIPWSF